MKFNVEIGTTASSKEEYLGFHAQIVPYLSIIYAYHLKLLFLTAQQSYVLSPVVGTTV